MTDKIKLMSDEEIEKLFDVNFNEDEILSEYNEHRQDGGKVIRDECEKRATEVCVKLIKHIYQLGCFELTESSAMEILQQFLKEQEANEEKVG